MVICGAAPTDLANLNCRPLIPPVEKVTGMSWNSLVAKGGQKCWVWFKGKPLEPDSGEWKAGWYSSVAPLGVIRCEHFDYVPCRLPQWRVSWDEPKDLKAAPEIPEDAEWKHWPVD